MTAAAVAATSPITRRVRAYFAPVDRVAGAPTLFDAAQLGTFLLDQPPAPWIDLGWCAGFTRKSGTKVNAVLTGAPATVQQQVRADIEATVSLRFETWGKLQLALASGSQQMNLLTTSNGAVANGSGGTAAVAVPLTAGGSTTATQLDVGAAASGYVIGGLVAVDVDYQGQTGYVGSGVSAGYVKTSAAVSNDSNYIRRVTLNVGVIVNITSGVLQLGGPLPAGVPTSAMKVSTLAGFVDREGGGFFQEWSGLFVMDGEQGDRVIFHYPRLQATQGAAEVMEVMVAPLEHVRLAGVFRALPVKDANDGETVLCFRSYLPGAMRAV